MSTRANIHLDDDAYGFAVAYARARDMPLGAAVSEILRRQAEQSMAGGAATSPRIRTNSHGLLVKAKTGRVVTAEIVKQSSEDDPASGGRGAAARDRR